VVTVLTVVIPAVAAAWNWQHQYPSFYPHAIVRTVAPPQDAAGTCPSRHCGHSR
jgi:hypothetical protein